MNSSFPLAILNGAFVFRDLFTSKSRLSKIYYNNYHNFNTSKLSKLRAINIYFLKILYYLEFHVLYKKNPKLPHWVVILKKSFSLTKQLKIRLDVSVNQSLYEQFFIKEMHEYSELIYGLLSVKLSSCLLLLINNNCKMLCISSTGQILFPAMGVIFSNQRHIKKCWDVCFFFPGNLIGLELESR